MYHASAVIHHENDSQLVQFYHATLGSPAISTFIEASARGYLDCLPQLTVQKIHRNKPHTIAQCVRCAMCPTTLRNMLGRTSHPHIQKPLHRHPMHCGQGLPSSAVGYTLTTSGTVSKSVARIPARPPHIRVGTAAWQVQLRRTPASPTWYSCRHA